MPASRSDVHRCKNNVTHNCVSLQALTLHGPSGQAKQVILLSRGPAGDSTEQQLPAAQNGEPPDLGVQSMARITLN